MLPITVTIVEPNGLLREGLQQLLRDPPFGVVNAVRVVSEASATDAPHVILWGPGAVGDIGRELTWAREHYCAGPCPARLILLADGVDTDWVRRVAALGADAVLSQDISRDVLHWSLNLVAAGQQLFPAFLAHAPAEGRASAQADLIPFPVPATPRLPVIAPERDVVLSEREGQILRCLLDGLSNKEIARDLRINEATVKGHIKGLLKKVRASNRTQAAVWALNNNFCVSKAVGEVTSLPTPGAASRAPKRAAGPAAIQPMYTV